MTEQELLLHLQKNPFLLAPMAGITDNAFRSLMKDLGCGTVITELVSATGLTYASQKTKDLMAYTENQRPIGIQLFGDDPEHMALAARYAQEQGADFVDVNLGCPVPKVVKKGAGSALLKDLPALAKILRAMKAATTLPITIKIRTGWTDTTRNADEVVQLAYNEGVTWVAIHGRTRAQGYSGKADWQYLAEIKQKSALPIIGNGDILTAASACHELKSGIFDGIMIGRGALRNPWIFRDSMALLNGDESQFEKKHLLDVLVLFKEKLSIFEQNQHWQTLQLRKIASWYSTGMPGSAQFRKALFTTPHPDDVWGIISTYYSRLQEFDSSQISLENMPMSGHG